MKIEIILLGLLICSTMTSLVTEAVKVLLKERNKPYRANALAAIISVIVAAAISAGYLILTKTAITGSVAVCVIALIVLSWLCAMVGYDKVVQAISQLRAYSGKDDIR